MAQVFEIISHGRQDPFILHISIVNIMTAYGLATQEAMLSAVIVWAYVFWNIWNMERM